MLNDPAQASEVRQPRAVVKIGGSTFDSDGSVSVGTPHAPIEGWIQWRVENNFFYQADRFDVTFAVSSLPADRDADWFSRQQEISVEIFAGFPADPDNYDAGQLRTWIYGLADGVEFDPVRRTIHLHGRDLTAKMIDAKTTEVFVNRTASDIAIKLAEKYGLTPRVTATKTKAGKYYELVHAHLNVARSEWDLLTFLAQQEQFSVYMVGRELHFEPMADANSEPYMLQWGEAPFTFRGSSLTFDRGLTLAKGIQVTVQSFNLLGNAVTATYPKKAGSNAQQFNYRFANLSPEKALQKAQALYHEIVRHEVNLHASMPADDILTTRNILKVAGTGTAYDQIYYPSSVRRSMSVEEGYRMDVSAKNQSPQTQVSL